jgi:Ca2+-binding EF-hand superfamily protein
MSVLVGVKLSEIARMIVSDTRDMVLLPSAGNSSDTGGDKSPSAHSDASSNSTGTPVKGLQLETMEMIQQHFAEADADASGSLSNDEIKTLLQEMIPGFEPDPAYLQELFSRFDCDSTGSIEVDEFARMYKFLQQHTGGVAESPKSSGGQTTPLKKLAKSFSRGSNKVLPPKLKRGTIRWLCNRWGPRVHPSKLRQIIRIIMFQNAMVVTQLIFSLWQIGASESSYFSEPTGWPAGSFGVQALLALLQLLHSAFLTLPMYSIVMQMGHHYNVRIFGMTAKMVVAWADKAKKSRTKKKLGVGSVATSSFRGRLVKLSSKVQPSPAQLAAAGEDAEVGVKRAAAQRATSGSGSPGLLRRSRTPTVAVLPSDESAEEGGGGGSIRPLELAPGLSAKYRVDGGGGGNEEPEDWLESAQRSVDLEENQDAAGEQGPEISPAPPPPPDDDGPQAAP